MKQRRKGILIIVIAAILVVAAVCGVLLKKGSKQQTIDPSKVSPTEIMQGIVDWKKSSMNIAKDQNLFNEAYTKLAGTSTGDWFVFAMARMGAKDDYEAYEKALEKNIVNRYKESGGLDRNKATEWHRTSLVMAAMGYDPTKVEADGKTINLVKDGTYDRGLENDLDAQGVNGYIWALILLDSKGYEIPKNACETKEDMIKQILTYQMENGAFGLTKGQESVDITAMALTALANYKDQEFVKTAIDKALTYLSNNQTERGTFVENGAESSESISQVLVALTALGINPNEDSRFIKKGNTVVDGLYSYRNADGGFRHTQDEKDASNSIASEQALYALVAYDMFVEGKGALYQFK